MHGTSGKLFHRFYNLPDPKSECTNYFLKVTGTGIVQFYNGIRYERVGRIPAEIIPDPHHCFFTPHQQHNRVGCITLVINYNSLENLL
jgi:hypothetical protein